MGHPLNWTFGWSLVLAAFLTGAILGLRFHDETFLGGYTSFRRRITRLGHIALAALGIMNALYGVALWPAVGSWQASVAGVGLMIGGVAMPAVCFLCAWRKPFRHLFFIPVVALLAAVVAILAGS